MSISTALLLAINAFSPASAQVNPQALEPMTAENADQAQQLAMLGRGWVTGLAWSPDGNTLAVASSAGVWLYGTAAPDRPLRLLHGHTDGVWSVAFSPDGMLLASGGSDNTVRLWGVLAER